MCAFYTHLSARFLHTYRMNWSKNKRWLKVNVYAGIIERKHSKTLGFPEKVEIMESLCVRYCPHNITLLHSNSPGLRFAHRTSKVLLWAFGLRPASLECPHQDSFTGPERGKASKVWRSQCSLWRSGWIDARTLPPNLHDQGSAIACLHIPPWKNLHANHNDQALTIVILHIPQ